MADEKFGNHAGGAAAALSDLERARRRTGATGGAQRRLHESAVDTFRDATALLRALRTYDAGHPRVEKFVDRLVETVDSYFRHAELLEVSLQPRALLGEHGAVFESPRAGDNPWLALFKAGVRRLSLARGVTRDELTGLCAIVGSAGDDRGAALEEDAVTLLWARGFEHIRFEAVDRFAAGAHLDDAGAPADALERALARHRRRDVRPSQLEPGATTACFDWLRARNLAVVAELPASARAVSYRLLEVDERDLAALAEACREDRTFVGRYFGALLGVLARRAHETDGQLVLERLRELCLELVSRRELRKAHQMLVHLGRATSGAPGVGDFLISDGAARHVVALMDAEPDSALEDDGLALLSALSAERATAVVEAATQVQRATLRARVFELATQWGATAAAAAEQALAGAGAAGAEELRAFLRDVRAVSLQRAAEAAHDGEAAQPLSPTAPAAAPSGKPRARRREARPTDLPPFRGAPMENVELPPPSATAYSHRPGRASRESVGPVSTRAVGAEGGDIAALLADYVNDGSEPDRGD